MNQESDRYYTDYPTLRELVVKGRVKAVDAKLWVQARGKAVVDARTQSWEQLLNDQKMWQRRAQRDIEGMMDDEDEQLPHDFQR